MSIYFHGSTLKNALEILKHDFNPDKKPDGTWNCSDDFFLYLWSFDKMMQDIGYYDDDDEEDERITEEAKDRCIYEGFCSASITAALNNALSTELVVFELEFKDELQDDLSCENMASMSNMIDLRYVSSDNIKSIYLCENGYEPMYRVFILHGLMGNSKLNICKLSAREESAIRAVSSDFYPNEDGFDWVTVDREKLLELYGYL